MKFQTLKSDISQFIIKLSIIIVIIVNMIIFAKITGFFSCESDILAKGHHENKTTVERPVILTDDYIQRFWEIVILSIPH